VSGLVICGSHRYLSCNIYIRLFATHPAIYHACGGICGKNCGGMTNTHSPTTTDAKQHFHAHSTLNYAHHVSALGWGSMNVIKTHTKLSYSICLRLSLLFPSVSASSSGTHSHSHPPTQHNTTRLRRPTVYTRSHSRRRLK